MTVNYFVSEYLFSAFQIHSWLRVSTVIDLDEECRLFEPESLQLTSMNAALITGYSLVLHS